MVDAGYFEYRGRSPFLDYGEVYLLTFDLTDKIEVKVRTGYSSRSRKSYDTKESFEREWKYRPDYIDDQSDQLYFR